MVHHAAKAAAKAAVKAGPVVVPVLAEAPKYAKVVIDRRRIPRSRSEGIYRCLDKVRVIGEAAVALNNEGLPGDSPRMTERTVADATALRDEMHELLADARLSSASQKSDLLPVAETAVGDVDRFMVTLNKWSLRPSDAIPIRDLQQAVQALNASEDALLSCMEKSRHSPSSTVTRSLTAARAILGNERIGRKPKSGHDK